MTETVAVVGGTGRLGAPVVGALLERGATVRVLSRTAAAVPAGAEHRRVDLTSGEGLATALAGATVVVDTANSTRGAEQTLVAGTRRLLEAGAAAGVGHHLAISIVGIDLVPMKYYRVKLAQEEAIESGPLPFSILRASQFHQLLDGALATAARFGVRPTGAAKLQPIDPAVVAARLADAALAAPAGRLPEIAGPQVQTLSELSRIWATARGRHRLPLRVPSLGKMGKGLAAGALCDPAAAAPGENFEEWLRHG
ncbi:MAG TPA: NAD(P)H-binding protein [Solirubrobacterales bacterium]|nr:NAD(P)H-binding protein [Solirubrobacterales bacterium]